jgi:hypothetical protein
LGNWFVHEHEYDVPIWDREQEPAR